MERADRPMCPRCGYDQTGIITSWTDSCPLAGVCSECGLTLDWAEVFNPPRDPWFVESGGGSGLVRRAWATWLWTLVPVVFWRRVGVRHEPAPRRMLVWLVVVLLSLHVVDGLLANASRFVEIVLVAPRGGRVPVIGGIPLVGQLFQNPQADTLAMWAAYASDDWTSPLFIVQYQVTNGLAYDSLRWQQLSAGVWAGLGITAAAPVMLLLLPQTRRMARVRPGHVLRAGVYSMAWVAAVWLLSIADAALNLAGGLTNYATENGVWGFWTGDIERAVAGMPAAWGSLLVLWWAMWWWSAIKHGLRISDAVAVWLAVVTPSLLIGAIVLAYADWL